MNYELTCVESDFQLSIERQVDDLELCLRHSGKSVLTTYSQFTPYSIGRPWRLKNSKFRKVDVIAENNSIIVTGETDFFHVEDKFVFKGEQLWINRKWKYNGEKNIVDFVLGTRLAAGNGNREKITIPNVIYNDNPGSSAERLIPHLHKEMDYSLVVEEHRLPIPAVNVEWKELGEFPSLTYFAMPSDISGGHCWSIGGIHNGQNLDIICLSGVLAFNNHKDMVYGGQNHMMEYPFGGYLELSSGFSIEKTMVIEFCSRKEEGRGFSRIVRVGMDLFKPEARPVLSIAETIKLKKNALINRWRGDQKFGGFAYLPDTPEEGNIYNYRAGYLFGWTGQSLRLAWCALKAGIRDDDKSLLNKGTTVMECFDKAPTFPGVAGMKYHYYDLIDRTWYADAGRRTTLLSSRMAGESLANFADCMILSRENNMTVKDSWNDTLTDTAKFLCSEKCLTTDGIYPVFFNSAGQANENLITGGGTSCVTGLIAAAEATGNAELAERGMKILKRYYELFGETMERPFSRATLDASCEDKESGIYFFLAAYRAFKLTGDSIFAEYAKLAAEWICTYIYLWDVKVRDESICGKNGFNSVFWPGVSVQNMHLDVFFPAYEIYDFGKITKDEVFTKIGKGVMDAWTHGIAQYPGHWGYPTPGEQGEQFNQTNYYQGPYSIKDWQGGFSPWNPSWIIALVLQAALKFDNE